MSRLPHMGSQDKRGNQSLIDEYVEKDKIDADYIYLLGGSMEEQVHG